MEIEKQRWEPLPKSVVPGGIGGFGWSQPFSVGSTYDWEDDMEKEEGLFLFDLEYNDVWIAGGWIKKSVTEFASYPDSWKLFAGDLDDVGFAMANVFDGKGGRVLDLDLIYRDGGLFYNVILVPNYGSAKHGSWFGSGATAANLADVLAGKAWGSFKEDNIKKKIVAIERRSDGKFAFALNEAKAGEAWWWGFGASIGNITTILNGGAWANFKADKVEKRLVSLKRHAQGNWTFLMVPRNGVGWWWYPAITIGDLAANAKQNSARIIDLERYGNSPDLFSAILVKNI